MNDLHAFCPPGQVRPAEWLAQVCDTYRTPEAIRDAFGDLAYHLQQKMAAGNVEALLEGAFALGLSHALSTRAVQGWVAAALERYTGPREPGNAKHAVSVIQTPHGLHLEIRTAA